MFINIISIHYSDTGEIVVDFKTHYGNGQGVWMTGQPNIGEEYDVEFDIEGIYQFNKDIIPVLERDFKIQAKDTFVIIYGLLEHHDEDGVSIIRLGNSLIMIATAGEPTPIGSPIKLSVKQLRLFNTNI